MVTICLGSNTADGVRNAFENVLFAVENYCDFLENNICGKEETSDAADAEETFLTEEQFQQRRRDGVRSDRRDTYSKDDNKLEGTLGGISEGAGEGCSGEECRAEGEGSNADDKQSTTATGEGDDHPE